MYACHSPASHLLPRASARAVTSYMYAGSRDGTCHGKARAACASSPHPCACQPIIPATSCRLVVVRVATTIACYPSIIDGPLFPFFSLNSLRRLVLASFNCTLPCPAHLVFSIQTHPTRHKPLPSLCSITCSRSLTQAIRYLTTPIKSVYQECRIQPLVCWAQT